MLSGLSAQDAAPPANPVRQHSGRQAPFAALYVGLVLAMTSGCGYYEYELRLMESRDYYAHLEKIENNLVPEQFSFAEDDITRVRVPKNFQLIPAPVPEKGPDGKLLPLPKDIRQPDYYTFTTLHAAWQATVDVTINEKAEKRDAYLYLVSNISLLAGPQEKKADAPDFTKRLVEDLTRVLNVRAVVEPILNVPKGKKYTPANSFQRLSFAAPKPLGGVRYDFELYIHEQGPLQTVQILAIPNGSPDAAIIRERMELSAEQFQVSPGATNRQPGAPAPGGSSSPAPASGGGGF